ncbi:glutamine synthetase family protein [Methanolapillus ohkumae]|uniref:Glutamine synthetase n=1 Tax=Methanolapillus ohkumae TaxID=3028298 RepID=A0AA96V508_9EURY|nr:Glutamine synthetase [Methanosarcinaceae archaeon Am2]
MVQFNTIAEILEGVSENDILFVKFQFSDLDGFFRELEIPASFLETAFSKGILFDSSIGGPSWSVGADVVLKPDPRTFTIVPASDDETDGSRGSSSLARVICELNYLDGQPFEGCPRGVLKKIVRKIFQSGYSFTVSTSLSFYLFEAGYNAADSDFNPPSRSSFSSHSSLSSPSGSFSLRTGNAAAVEKAKKEILFSISNSDIDILSFHKGHENGQYAIVFKDGSALRIADNVLTVKQIIRTASEKYGLHASFMPKPMTSKEGLSMPFSFSLLKNEINEFYHPDKEMMLSDSARSFIAGIFKHVGGICAVSNPTVNSYKRLVKQSEAPHYITWSTTDRHSLIHVPSSRGRSTKIELRSPDSSCNPYLALSLIISAGISGINEHLLPNQPVGFETHDYSESEKKSLSQGTLPGTFIEAIDKFRSDTILKSVLGDLISNGIIQKAAAEWDEYVGCVHQWEVNRYL